jgi:hypothetical protein
MVLARVIGENLARDASSLAPASVEHDAVTDRFLDTCGQWLASARELLADLEVEAAARDVLERRCLAGHGALFPESLSAWAELEPLADALTEVIGDLARRLPRSVEPAGVGPSLEARIDARRADLLDRALATAYDQLGDLAAGYAVERRRLWSVEEPDLPAGSDAPIEGDMAAGGLVPAATEPTERAILRRGRWHQRATSTPATSATP